MDFCLKFLVMLAFLVALDTMATAHDKWANGEPIPQWIKDHCCSGDEAVDLTRTMGITAGSIHIREGGAMHMDPENRGTPATYVYYRVEGFDNEVAAAKVYPSQDGHVWAFYAKTSQPPQAVIYCLFVPCVSNSDMPTDLNSSCS